MTDPADRCALSVRPATRGDARDLWLWRNDPLTERMSRTQDPVPWDDHVAWVEASLQRASRTLLIAEDAAGVKVGVVRFDLASDRTDAEVSIALSPACRGRRLALPVLLAGIGRFRVDHSCPLLAEIRPDNTASLRCFEQAGFLPITKRSDFCQFRLPAPGMPDQERAMSDRGNEHPTASHEDIASGETMHGWATDLFPVTRSLTGPGFRQSLDYVGARLPGLSVRAIASGSQVFDWTVPDEWTIRDAYVATADGERVIDFQRNNLHVVGYSTPIDADMTRSELDGHLHSLPDLLDAIPYVTSYYVRRWGFCLSQHQRDALPDGPFHVRIDSDLEPGVLNYADLIIPGASSDEVLISTYLCHPSMANNELSGPVVTLALARWLQSRIDRRFTYRIVFVPETIGSLVYLSRHLDQMRERCVAGFNITCVGDDRTYSYLPSRAGDTVSDQAALHALRHLAPHFDRYSWLDRGSDERQYCAPGIDLPVATIMRSKYGTYPEYHTSLDDLTLVTPSGLAGAFRVLRHAILAVEQNRTYQTRILGEPQMGKRGLYPTLSTRGAVQREVKAMMDMISYSDGSLSLLRIADILGEPIWYLAPLARKLADADVLSEGGTPSQD